MKERKKERKKEKKIDRERLTEREIDRERGSRKTFRRQRDGFGKKIRGGVKLTDKQTGVRWMKVQTNVQAHSTLLEFVEEMRMEKNTYGYRLTE